MLYRSMADGIVEGLKYLDLLGDASLSQWLSNHQETTRQVTLVYASQYLLCMNLVYYDAMTFPSYRGLCSV